MDFKKKLALFIFCLVLLSNCGGKAQFQKAEKIGTVESYERFVFLFPLFSKHTKTAELRIQELKLKGPTPKKKNAIVNNVKIKRKEKYEKKNLEEKLNVKFYGVCTTEQLARMIKNGIDDVVINKICKKGTV